MKHHRKQKRDVVLSEELRRVKLTEDQEAWFGLPGVLPVAPLLGYEKAIFGGESRPWTEVDVPNTWLEVDIGDRWRAALRLVPFRGQPVVAEVRLFPRDDWSTRRQGQWRGDYLGILAGAISGERAGRRADDKAVFPPIRQGITMQNLKDIRLGSLMLFTQEFVEKIRDAWERSARKYVDGSKAPEPLPWFAPAPEPAKPRRRGHPGWPDRVYAEIAAAYVERLEAGSSRPIADVARRRKLSPAQVRDAIHRARHKRGLLTKESPDGGPGGQLTERAKQLLRAKKKKTGRGRHDKKK